MEVSLSTFQIRPVCTTMTAAISDIIDKNSGRRPTRSIRNPDIISANQVFCQACDLQGMNEAAKNQEFNAPDMSAERFLSKPRDFSNIVLE